MPGPDNLRKLAEALRVSTDALMGHVPVASRPTAGVVVEGESERGVMAELLLALHDGLEAGVPAAELTAAVRGLTAARAVRAGSAQPARTADTSRRLRPPEERPRSDAADEARRTRRGAAEDAG